MKIAQKYTFSRSNIKFKGEATPCRMGTPPPHSLGPPSSYTLVLVQTSHSFLCYNTIRYDRRV